MLRCRDAAFGLLLEHVQNVNGLWKPHRIDSPERISPEVRNNLQHARCNTLQGLGVFRHLALWTRSNANPTSSLTSSGSSRSTSSESPMNLSGLIEGTIMVHLYDMLVLAYCQVVNRDDSGCSRPPVHDRENHRSGT